MFSLVGGPRLLLGGLEPERRRVLAKRRDVAIGVLAQRHAGLVRFEDRAVVDVGEVHHVPHVEALLVLERPAQDVDGDERAEVADVAARVDGQAARIHADLVVAGGREVFFAAGQRVVKAHELRMARRSRPSIRTQREISSSGSVASADEPGSIAGPTTQARTEAAARRLTDRRRGHESATHRRSDGTRTTVSVARCRRPRRPRTATWSSASAAARPSGSVSPR